MISPGSLRDWTMFAVMLIATGVFAQLAYRWVADEADGGRGDD